MQVAIPERTFRNTRRAVGPRGAIGLAAMLALILLACGDRDRLAGGTGSEAGDAYGMAWSSAAERPAPAARIRVYRRAESPLVSPVLDTVLGVDASGRISVRRPPGRYAFEIVDSAADELAYLGEVKLSPGIRQNLGTIHLLQAASLEGIVTDSTASPGQVWMAGTPYASEIPGYRSFQFSRLPSGSYTLMHRSGGQDPAPLPIGKITLGIGQSARSDSLRLHHGELLLEDFEGWDAANLLSPWLGGGFWNPKTDGRSTMSPAAGSFPTAYRDSGAYRGKSLQVKYSLDTASSAWIQVGMDLTTGRTHDLTGARALRFHARGDGPLRVELARWDGATYRFAGSDLVLDTAWTEHILPIPQAFSTRDSSGVEALLRVCNRLVFTAHTRGSVFHLDEVRLEGLSLERFLAAP